MIAAMFLRDAFDASAAEPAPRLGDHRATAINGGLFEAGGLCDAVRPLDQQHLRQSRSQLLEQGSGEWGLGHGRDIVTAEARGGNVAQTGISCEGINPANDS